MNEYIGVNTLNKVLSLKSPSTEGFWAETYRNGRLTGRILEVPTRDVNGDVVGAVRYEDEDGFIADFEWQQHDECHSPSWHDYACLHCQAAGWVG